MNKIGIIDIGSGNLFSLIRSLRPMDIKAIIVNKPGEIQSLDAIVLPGVGAYKSGMQSLKKSEIIDELNEHRQKGKLILGICLGMQLLLSESLEFGNYKGLNYIPGIVKPIPISRGWPVPNIGWCEVEVKNKNILSPFSSVKNNTDFYFIHSYFCDLYDKENIIGEISYGDIRIATMISHQNTHGCQFHPELSDRWGYKILADFIKLI